MSTQAPSQECPPKPNVRTDDRARFVCQPNSLGYQDENGIERNIRLPPGTVEIAWDHAVNKRWEELAKYETISKCRRAGVLDCRVLC